MKLLTLVIAVFLFTPSLQAQVQDSALTFSLLADTVNPIYYVSGPFAGCPVIGQGKRMDPYLNTLKNRDISPPGKYTLVDLQQILAYRPKLAIAEGGKARRRWQYDAASEITSWRSAE